MTKEEWKHVEEKLNSAFGRVDLLVKGYYIKLLHPTNRNAYLVYCWEIVRLMEDVN